MDVDIDVPGSFDPLKIFPQGVRASIYREKKLTPHASGLYLQNVPTDPITGLSAIPYDVAPSIGAFKVDFLPLHIYNHFSSRDEIKELLKYEPDWTLLRIPSVVNTLFHLSKHFELVQAVGPTSIIELADTLALRLPAKVYLLKYYLEHRELARKMLYDRDVEGYAFKKAHAIAYAMVIVLQLHLIKGGVTF